MNGKAKATAFVLLDGEPFEVLSEGVVVQSSPQKNISATVPIDEIKRGSRLVGQVEYFEESVSELLRKFESFFRG